MTDYIKQTEQALYDYLPDLNCREKELIESMKYSLEAGGKRVRPNLVFSFNKLCNGKTEAAIPFACAVEMIHTYSLIHDDLPAMDNDDLRRGMPTSHIKFGEATAILAGDALLNKAFEVVSQYNGNNPQRAIKAMNMLAVSSGTEGMIGGQIVDMESEGKDGKSVDEIITECEKYIKTWRCYLLVDTLKYLEKGGRLSKAAAFVGTMLDIKPILTIEHGLVESLDKLRGKKKLLDKLIAKIQDDSDFDAENPKFLIVQSDEDKGQEVCEKLRDEYGEDCIEMYGEFGPLIGTHVGRGAIAILVKIVTE